MADEKTQISNSSMSIEDLLSMGGPENLIVVETEEQKQAKLKAEQDAKAAADKKAADDLIAEQARIAAGGPPAKPVGDLEDVLNFSGEEIKDEEEEEDKPGTTGKTKDTDLAVLKELVEEGIFYPFEAEEGQQEKPIEQYSKKERIELIKANVERIRKESEEKAPVEFFDNLSPELQLAAQYEANGGKDLTAFFNYLAQSQQVKNLDVADPKDQETIVRKWGALTDLTAEEIEEEVTSLKDMPGALEKKAAMYKPKLDAKQQEVIEKQLKDQENRRKSQEAAAVKYRENIYNALSPGELNGIKLDKNTQALLFNGLVKADYPSVSGRNTNLLGHLLETHQFVKPNPTLIAEALWLLQDPEAYRAQVKKLGANAAAVETAKVLKTSASEKVTAAGGHGLNTQTDHKKTVKKQSTSLFSRTP